MSGRVVDAKWGGLRIELPSGEPAWIRRNDLTPDLRPKDPRSLVGRVFDGLTMGPDAAGRGTLVSPRHLIKTHFGRAHEAGKRLGGRVVEANRGGVVVEVDGLKGFAPRSELRRGENADHWSLEGQDWRGWVLKVSTDEVLLTSYSPWRQRSRTRQRRRYVRRISVGDARRGRIHQLNAAGAVVRLHRAGVYALVPEHDLRDAEREGDLALAREGARIRVRITSVGHKMRRDEPVLKARLAR